MAVNIANTITKPIEYIISSEKWVLKRIALGLSNIIRLHGYNPMDLVCVLLSNIKTAIYCKNIEKLFVNYI
jgi:hypothetical protein